MSDIVEQLGTRFDPCIVQPDELSREAAAEITRVRAEVERRDLALQSLTPKGSEYVNDPDRCVAYVRERFQSGHDAKMEAVRLRARVAELEAALRSIAANTCCDSCREAALVASLALEPRDA